VFGAILFSTATLHSLAFLCALMLFGGAAWTVFMSIFNTMIQSLAPDWIRARVMASYLFVFQGSVTVGSTLWGFAAERASVRAALLVSAFGIAASVLLQFPLRLPNTSVDLSKWNHWATPKMFEEHDPDLGPVLVSVKYVIDPAKAPDFLNEIYKYQRIRRRDGATRWGIYYDTDAPNVYLETFLVDSWLEHQRQHDRFTVEDHELEKRVLSYALEPATVKHYIHAERNDNS
jgi:MFS family permease